MAKKTTIDDYIERHGLTKRRFHRGGQFVPAMLTPENRDDNYEIYANDDGTHVVSMNTTLKQFRIVHGDLLFLVSDWKDAQIAYQTDAEPFWDTRD